MPACCWKTMADFCRARATNMLNKSSKHRLKWSDCDKICSRIQPPAVTILCCMNRSRKATTSWLSDCSIFRSIRDQQQDQYHSDKRHQARDNQNRIERMGS